MRLLRIRRAWFWARARGHSVAADVAAALADIQRIEAIGPLRAYEKAFKAGVLLRLGRHQAAERLFVDVAASTRGSADANDHYVNLYSNFILSEMRGDIVAQQRLREEAHRVECRPVLRRWLPL